MPHAHASDVVADCGQIGERRTGVGVPGAACMFYRALQSSRHQSVRTSGIQNGKHWQDNAHHNGEALPVRAKDR
jgi:hypothetical protein